MDTNAVRSEVLVDPRDVHVRAVWESLASPMAVAFVTDDQVTLLTGAGVDALVDDGDVLSVGDIRIGGSAEERRVLLDEARQVPERIYLEMGDVDVVPVEGGVELRRTTGDGLQESAATELAELLQLERHGWQERGVNYAKWSFSCGGHHFVTTPLRASFVADRITTALDRVNRFRKVDAPSG